MDDWSDEKCSMFDDLHERSDDVRLRKSSWWEKLRRPFHTWSRDFQKDHCCSKKDVAKEFLVAALPYAVLNVVLFLYVLFGGFLFAHFEAFRSRPPQQIVLFAFTTIATIGYGDVAPTTFEGKIACIAYSAIGVPLLFYVLGSNGKLLVAAYNSLCKTPEEEMAEALPINVSMGLLILLCQIGGLIFSCYIDSMDFISAAYFSFISISTIGFGDFVPTPDTWFEVLFVIFYFQLGIVVMATLVVRVCVWVKWLNSYIRGFTDSSKTEIWLDGNMLTVEELVIVIGTHFENSPQQMKKVIHDLDAILELAFDSDQLDEERKGQNELSWSSASAESGESQPPSPRKCVLHVETGDHKTVRVIRGSQDSSDEIQRTIQSGTFSGNYRTIPKETEHTLEALGTITHHLRKASERRRAPSLPRHPHTLHFLQRQESGSSLGSRSLDRSPSLPLKSPLAAFSHRHITT